MRVLVAYGSRMGGTTGIAEAIAQTLRQQGLEAEMRAARAVKDVRGYDAVIVGGALYANRWHKDARRLVKKQTEVLKTKPVWLFSSGPLDDSAAIGDLPPVEMVERLMGPIQARGHRTFGGRMPADADWFPASAMAKKHAGDWRDIDQARLWATEIASELSWKLEPA